ncbi:thrombospondin type 3 repeat-containing protein [Luminiphilus sp.]|nr:thrombospondin type 3 repeat-containing protein [Luminiphilus sp.]
MDFIQKFVFFVFLVSGSVSQAEVYDVSTTAEFREALASAAEAGGDNTIRLAAGSYSTQDDGGGVFVYLSQYDSVLTVKAQDIGSPPTLDGANTDSILAFNMDGQSLYLSLQYLTFENAGAGAVNFSSGDNSIEVLNVTFSNNTGSDEGGAISGYFKDVAIRGSSFTANYGCFDANGGCLGGAVSLRGVSGSFEISDSTFTNNRARYGGIQLRDKGGAIYLNVNSGDQITAIHGNQFTGNSAFDGGAIWASIGDRDRSVNIYDNSFTQNGAYDSYNPTGVIAGDITRDIYVSGNYFSDNDTPLLNVKYSFNNIFVENRALEFSSGRLNNNLFLDTSIDVASYSKVTNNIFLGDSAVTGDGPFFLTANNNYINNDQVLNGIQLDGTGNIYEGIALGFVNAEEGDYRLSSSSDLIDAGTTDPELAYITDYDYTGTTARVIGASIDIGPYEYDGEAPADSDGDGVNNNIDNCPTVYNEDQADNDSDGEGDVCDSDDDNDGTNDEDDAFPFDDTESLDTDSDGIGNNEDEDDDGDGFLDDSDPQPIIANVFAIDSDGDGVADSIDDYPTDATKQFSSDGDFDGDGFTNDEEVDYCTNPFDKNSQPDVGGLSVWMLYLGTQQQDTQ